MVTSLSVVVPAYNEEANVAKCIKSVAEVLKKTDLDWEIIVVNDGSKDKTLEVAEAEIKKLKLTAARVVTNKPNRGYGGSLKAGFAAAGKEFIAFVPADNQFDFSQIQQFIKLQAETDADIVSGIRPGGGHDPVSRLAVRWAWNTLLRGMFGYLASDIDCGFKLFRRSILETVKLPSDGAMVDTQLIAGARARGMKIAELPVKHLPRTAGVPTGGSFKVWLKAWRELVIFWWQLKHELRVERGKTIFRWELIAISLILAVAALTRLYRISEYMTFLGDEGRDVSVVRDMVLGRKFTLIGPGTSIGNMYLGPLYYYLMIPALALWRLSPVGPAVMIAGFGILTVALVWWVGRQWFGRGESLLAALLYALSPTIIIYSRSSWNPNIMPFFALLGMYGIWKVWKYGYWRWLVISAICLAFVLNSHYLGLLLVPVMGWYWLKSKKTGPWLRYTLVSIGIFLLLMAPLFLFDLRHNFMNFLAMKAFFTDRQTTVNLKFYKSIPLLWPLWQQIVSTLTTAGNMLAATIVGIVFAILLLLGFKNKNTRGDLGFLVWWLGVGLVGLGLYKQHIYAHYFGFLFPAVFLGLGFCLHALFANKITKILGLIGICGLLALEIMNSPLWQAPNNQLAHTRQVADFIEREAGGNNFNLALLSKSNYDMSYRYFLPEETTHLRTMHEQITGQLFVICEQETCQPIGNPLWEIASFGWGKIDRQWEFPWGVKLFRLVPNPSGKPA